MNSKKSLPAILTTAALLTACGGGGGSSKLAAPEGLSYPAVSAYYILSVDAPANVPSVAGEVSTWSVSPALPAGLILDPATGAVSGRPTETAPPLAYTVTASNTAGSASFEIVVGVTEPPRYAYVPNTEDDTISQYTVDAYTGELHFNGYVRTPDGQDGPERIAVHPDGQFVYAVNLGDGLSLSSISVYALSQETGRLSPLSSIAAGIGPHDVAMDAEGKFLYVTSFGSDLVEVFSIDQDTGALTSMGGPGAVEDGPTSISLDPMGRFAYVTNENSGTITIFRVDSESGFLSTGLKAVDVEGVPTRVTVGPSGERAYVVLGDGETVRPYEIDPESGDLLGLPETPTGALPSAVAVHPTGAFAYVANASGNDISVYGVDPASGELSPAGSVETGGHPTSVCFDASGLYAYVTGRDSNDVSVYRVDLATGGLISAGAVRTREEPRSLAITQGAGPLRIDAAFLYVANGASMDVTSYSVDAVTGALTELGPPVVAAVEPRDVAVDPLGRFLFVADTAGGLITTFSIDEVTGEITKLGLPDLLTGKPRGIDVDPSGRFLYVAVRDADEVLSFSYDGGTGELTPIDAKPAGENPHSVSVDPTGRFVYVTNAVSNDITAWRVEEGEFVGSPTTATGPGTPLELRFSPRGDFAYAPLKDADHLVPYWIDPENGALTPIPPGKATENQPTAIVVHPSGRFAYAAVSGLPSEAGNVTVYCVDRETGHLTQVEIQREGLNPRDVAVDPSGRFLYAANEGGDDISHFAVDAASGLLDHQAQVPTGLGPKSITFTRVQRTVIAP